jgi:hypothetical protein
MTRCLRTGLPIQPGTECTCKRCKGRETLILNNTVEVSSVQPCVTVNWTPPIITKYVHIDGENRLVTRVGSLLTGYTEIKVGDNGGYLVPDELAPVVAKLITEHGTPPAEPEAGTVKVEPWHELAWKRLAELQAEWKAWKELEASWETRP